MSGGPEAVRVLHELTPQQVSLEEAFMDLTRDDIEFKAGTIDEAA